MRSVWLRLALCITALVALVGTGEALALNPTRAQQGPPPAPNSRPAVRHHTLPPLRHVKPARPRPGGSRFLPPDHGLPPRLLDGGSDPVRQATTAATRAPAPGLNAPAFEGIGQGLPPGPSSPYTSGYNVTSAPPDPNGDVGPNYYVEIVNTDFAIFDKSGQLVYGPVPTNTLWQGLGSSSGCQVNNDGDATVKYDRLSHVWIVSQFSVSSPFQYSQCVAVSSSDNPVTSTWHQYEFGGFGNNFPDYPKLGVWSDAYYETFNLFNGNTFVGPEVCAYDKASMIAGTAARPAQCRTMGTQYGGLLPADVDGSNPPPAGAPGYIADFNTNSLDFWNFHVDWSNPANTRLSTPASIPVAAFTPACNGGGVCIPQPGTSERLDSLADRLMYRLAYRNFGDHESLVVDHSIVSGSSVGVRWYELRNPPGTTAIGSGTPVVYQQGTYAPDGTYRWMGSTAMDGSGSIALGFSASSGTVAPSIHYTGRLACDPLGTMGFGEGTMVTGTGSQTNGLNRWGDYTSLAVDPTDDHTFWYVNQYQASNGTFNWHTKIGAFQLPGSCTPDFTVSAVPSSQTVAPGGSTSYTVTSTPQYGYARDTTLSVSGLPSGATAGFSPSTIAGGSGSATLNVATGTAAVGTYPLTISETDGSLTHTTGVQLVVKAPAPDFSLSAAPMALSIPRGSSGQTTVSVTPVNGFSAGVGLKMSVQPSSSRISGSFNPPTASATGNWQSKLTITANSRTTKGTYTVTVTGTGGGLSHTTTVKVTV